MEDHGNTSDEKTPDEKSSDEKTSDEHQLQQAKPHRPLIIQDLPSEVLLEIMRHMPYSTLYLFQQTCSTLRQLSQRNFKEFNLEFRSDGSESYCISEANHRQRQIIRDTLTHSTQCEHCYSRRETGVLQKEMKRLYRPFYCSACKEDHPTLFFSPEERRKKPHEYTQCLGRVGNFTFCSHKSLPAPDLVTLANICEQEEIKIVCNDQSHVLQPAMENSLFYPTFPHSLIVRSVPQILLKAGCLPSMLVFTVNKNVEFLKLGMQDSLSDKERAVRLQDAYQASIEIQQTCSCIILKVEHNWTSTNFLSPAWLFNLDFYKDQDCDARLKRNPLYDERTKHILWCDTPGCETGSERRWMNMAKAYLKWNVTERTSEFDWCHRSRSGSGLPTGFWDLHWLSFTYEFFHSVGKHLKKGEEEEGELEE
ncbi:hypothetical protein FAVG1_06558 [Fusarium avenaceum]|nr:hypothetical protein FAVG1_06558 [Fusarium avenaceum]